MAYLAGEENNTRGGAIIGGGRRGKRKTPDSSGAFVNFQDYAEANKDQGRLMAENMGAGLADRRADIEGRQSEMLGIQNDYGDYLRQAQQDPTQIQDRQAANEALRNLTNPDNPNLDDSLMEDSRDYNQYITNMGTQEGRMNIMNSQFPQRSTGGQFLDQYVLNRTSPDIFEQYSNPENKVKSYEDFMADYGEARNSNIEALENLYGGYQDLDQDIRNNLSQADYQQGIQEAQNLLSTYNTGISDWENTYNTARNDLIAGLQSRVNEATDPMQKRMNEILLNKVKNMSESELVDFINAGAEGAGLEGDLSDYNNLYNTAEQYRDLLPGAQSSLTSAQEAEYYTPEEVARRDALQQLLEGVY